MRLIPFVVATMMSITAVANAERDVLHIDWLDKHTSPFENFYTYANGTWQKNTPIPADYPCWGAFNILNEQTQDRIHEILIKASNNSKSIPGSIEQKIGDFYYSGMDQDKINALGITPLTDELNRINDINTVQDLYAEIAHLHQIGVDVLFAFGSMQDFADSTKVIGALVQSGLTLPDRDYYLKSQKKFQQIRNSYKTYLTNIFILSGDAPKTATDNANTVITIETALAKASLSQTAQRDPHAIYHMMDIAKLQHLTNNYPWGEYFSATCQNNLQQVNVAMPKFMHAMNEQLQQHSLSDWKIYLKAHLINTFAPYLSDPFVNETFRMTKALVGSEKLLPRWKRVVKTENSALGFAIGEVYVKQFFSADEKSQVLSIMHNIHNTLRDDLNTLPWMTPATRKAAIQKLDIMEERVGYPEKWWDYSTLNINKNTYLLNVLHANQFLVKRDLNKIGKPLDRYEWGMSPQTINAYYDASMNSINIPMGILQPPFFDPQAPAAVNYGAIGFIIGHEITHGFDDQGAKFDAHGNLHNWWTPHDLQQFKAATRCIATQFSSYKVLKDLSVNGELVVGEAAADLGGITLAYRAYIASNEYKQAKTINGFTPSQQFFLGAAHIWAESTRPEYARNLITIDPHPPSLFRVNGTLANMPEFQAAFAVPLNSLMINKHRCILW